MKQINVWFLEKIVILEYNSIYKKADKCASITLLVSSGVRTVPILRTAIGTISYLTSKNILSV